MVGVRSHPTGQRRGNEIPPSRTADTPFSSSYLLGSSTLTSLALGRIGAGVGEEEPAGTLMIPCSSVPAVNLVDSSVGTLVTASLRPPSQAETCMSLCSSVPAVNLVDSSVGTLVTALPRSCARASYVPTAALEEPGSSTLVTMSPRSPAQGYKAEPQRSALSKRQLARQRACKQNRE